MINGKINKFLDIIIVLLIVSLIAYTVFSYATLPSSIPNHLDSNGNAKDYMSKAFIIFLATIGSILGIAMQVLAKYPSKFNYVVTITPRNKEVQYSMAKVIIRILNICTILSFFTMNFCIINSLKSTFIYVILLFMVLSLIIYIIKSIKNK